MPRRRIIEIVAAALVTVFPILATAPAAIAGALEVTAKQQEYCARADKRYKELYPDAKDDGVVVVKLYKYTFCPPNITVKAGTTVRWVNVDKRTSHSVWLKDAGKAESERFFPEEQWEFPFMAAGEYPYLCGPHWEQEGMRGYVKVVE
jgi:plastocyanin